jgi:hypothetical protein
MPWGIVSIPWYLAKKAAHESPDEELAVEDDVAAVEVAPKGLDRSA